MSTFYATFPSLPLAEAAADEMLRGGLSPDSLSIVANASHLSEAAGEGGVGRLGTVGDATSRVARADDPIGETMAPDRNRSTTTFEEPGTMGIDTSDIGRDVESLDQNDDSQEAAGEAIYPEDGISHSEHDRDELNLAVLTGFPTAVPLEEDDRENATAVMQDQNADGLDRLEIGGHGLIIGGGELATAALEFLRPDGDREAHALVGHLRNQGMSERQAENLRVRFLEGVVLVAVEIVPGSTDEGAVEELVARHGSDSGGLVDAPRFYTPGGNAG